ncbi:MAG: creatininase family protein [Bacillati bacterium ANGP1]|uniref:Creatininase family protein n=1 Tax=Candidatus Segetimicrobium genomatis TaxID=2569760 RepID=A0A537JYN6_9BACT|nr:MAG: creatininase family protein [Terrabacteria group bacterium ANGP1]
MRRIEYELMRPPDIVKERDRVPLAFVPIGPLEWHGPHLPLGTDGLHAHEVAVEVARRIGGIVLPTYFVGTETVRLNDQQAQGLAVLGFNGTERVVGMDFPEFPVKSLYFEEGVFAVTVREILRLLKADGYKLVVIVNGHGAVNHQRTLRRLAAEESERPTVRVEYTMAFLPGAPPLSDPGHAEKIETSLMMAMRPELVDVASLPPTDVPLRYRDYGVVDGKAFDGNPTPDFTLRREADPRDAAPDLGRKVLNAEVDRLAEIVSAHLRSMGLGNRD